MPSKNGTSDRRLRRSRSSSTSTVSRERRRQAAKEVDRRRRRSSSSHSSRSRDRKKLRPKKRSKSPGRAAPATAERMAFDEKPSIATAPKAGNAPQAAPKVAAKATGAAAAASASGASPPASPPAEGSLTVKAPVNKLDLSNLGELQAKLEEDRNRLELFVIKAKREHDEKRETKEKLEQREKEYYHAELEMPFGPDNRFLCEDMLGKGVFSTVYRGKDFRLKGKLFAIKFIRKDPMCRRATEKELKLMRRLRNQASLQDPEGAQRLLGLDGMEQFEHEGHLAVVLQLMKCDLRVGLRKYGQGNGLPLPFVLTFARDIFLALRALRSIKVVHTDLKPDNLLISLDRTCVKLSDFGSAMDTNQTAQVYTDYLQPRFYRAPEVIMGQPYTTQIDVWSAGVTLYELTTDRTLFRGENNNAMIHAMLKICGSFTKSMATSGKFVSKHFNENGEYLLKDKTGAIETLAMSTFEKPSPSLLELLEDPPAKPVPEGSIPENKPRPKPDAKTKAILRQLADLISSCCKQDPEKRITPTQALSHAFLKKVQLSQADSAKAS